VKNPVTIAPEALDFTRLIRSGETVGWAEATAEPVFLTRLLDAQAGGWRGWTRTSWNSQS
jgi:hypothetical protein